MILLVALFVMVASVPMATATTPQKEEMVVEGSLVIKNVIKTEFEAVPKRIYYKKNKDGTSKLVITLEKPIVTVE